MAKSGIYRIEHAKSGRCYIGSAVSIDKRWREHRRQLSSGKHHSRFMQRVADKHGAESLTFSVLLYCAREDLIGYEQRAIDSYRPEFNSAPTAGSQLGYRHSDESRRRMSASRPKGFSPMTGKKHTDEARARISASRKGKGGGQRSAEWRANLSSSQRGRIISADHRARIAATLTGHKQSPEQIEKRMQKLRGRKMPAGFSEAASARMSGRKLPHSHCVSIGRSKARLSEDQVREIRCRRANGEARKALSLAFSIDPASITNIAARKSYGWVS